MKTLTPSTARLLVDALRAARLSMMDSGYSPRSVTIRMVDEALSAAERELEGSIQHDRANTGGENE